MNCDQPLPLLRNVYSQLQIMLYLSLHAFEMKTPRKKLNIILSQEKAIHVSSHAMIALIPKKKKRKIPDHASHAEADIQSHRKVGKEAQGAGCSDPSIPRLYKSSSPASDGLVKLAFPNVWAPIIGFSMLSRRWVGAGKPFPNSSASTSTSTSISKHMHDYKLWAVGFSGSR